jgi:hypothetical protein
MALCEGERWYEPLPPAKAGERIQARTSGETFIYVLAERTADVSPFAQAPHQTDYVSNLDVLADGESPAPRSAAAVSTLKALRKRAGDLKRRYVYGVLPWLGQIEERLVRYQYLRHDRLNNARRFRAIGKRLFTAILGYFAAPLEFGFECGSGACSVLF